MNPRTCLILPVIVLIILGSMNTVMGVGIPLAIPRMERLAATVPIPGTEDLVAIDLALGFDGRGKPKCAGECTVDGINVIISGKVAEKRGLVSVVLTLKAVEPKIKVKIKGVVDNGMVRATIKYAGTKGKVVAKNAPMDALMVASDVNLILNPEVADKGLVTGLADVASDLHGADHSLFMAGKIRGDKFTWKAADQSCKLSFKGVRSGKYFIGNLVIKFPPVKMVVSGYSIFDPALGEWSPEEDAVITGIIDEAGMVPQLAEDSHEVTSQEVDRSGDKKYIEEKHDVVDNIDNITYLGLNDDIIWPGNIVKGERAYDFIYDPIAVARAPITLSLNLESSTTTGSSITQVVEDPKLSNVRQGISDLLKKAITEDTKVPAKVDFKYQQVYSLSQMNIFAGADVSYGAGSLDTKFNWDTVTSKSRIMVKYQQIYYSVDIDPPPTPAAFFSPSLKVDQLANAMPQGSMPLYVAGVSYGMMAYMFIETEYSADVMRLALDAAYSGVVDVEVSGDLTAKEILQSASIQIVVYGGSTLGLQELETGFQGFMNVVSASSEFGSDSPGVPLIYKFRHLSDNTLALITLTSQYTLVRPIRIQQRVSVKVDQFVLEFANDEGPDDAVDIDRLFVWVNAFNKTSANDPGVQINPVNEQVFGWSTPDYVEMGGIGHPVVFPAGTSIVLTFDTENYDFELARLSLSAWARDWDTSDGDSENAFNTIELTGNDMFGTPKIMLFSSDFTMAAYLTIRPLN